jgi:uncharacterized membrane protein SirB2
MWDVGAVHEKARRSEVAVSGVMVAAFVISAVTLFATGSFIFMILANAFLVGGLVGMSQRLMRVRDVRTRLGMFGLALVTMVCVMFLLGQFVD